MENKEISCLSILEKTEILQSLVDCIELVDIAKIKKAAALLQRLNR